MRTYINKNTAILMKDFENKIYPDILYTARSTFGFDADTEGKKIISDIIKLIPFKYKSILL